MNRTDYDKMLGLTLEAEGLLMLLREREEDAPRETEALLREKISALATIAGADVRRCKLTESADEAKKAAAVLFEESEDAGVKPEPTPEETTDSAREVASTLFEETEDAEPGLEEPATIATIECIGDSTSNGLRLDEKIARDNAARDIRSALSLNDRYRFRRELFGGSEARMADALDVITAMHSYDEAEEYFYSDLCWDPENAEVKDFMAIIANHFGANGR